MKYFILSVALIASNIYASDADQKLCDHLKRKTFASFSDGFGIQNDKKLSTVVKKTSDELSKKVREQCESGGLRSAVLDYDSCSLQCIQFGSSAFRVEALMKTNGLIDLNEETRECQKLCKSYQLYAFAYLEGIEAAAGEGLKDCQAHVNGQSGTTKSDFSEKVSRKARQTSGSGK